MTDEESDMSIFLEMTQYSAAERALIAAVVGGIIGVIIRDAIHPQP